MALSKALLGCHAPWAAGAPRTSAPRASAKDSPLTHAFIAFRTPRFSRSQARPCSIPSSLGRMPTHSQRRACAARAAGTPDPAEVAGPLSPESPPGQLLRELIQSHPHLVPSAAEQQLGMLAQQQEQQQQEGQEEGAKRKGSDLVLYRRIEEMRKQERQRAIEEVIYSLIVQRFIDAGAPLLPKVPFVALDPSNPLTAAMMGLVPSAATKSRQLEGVHSPEVLEMVHEHMERVLGGKGLGAIPGGPSMEDRVLVGTSKMRLGQVYAASIMYGYFLRRVDQRFQLEKGVRLMLGGFGAGAAAEEASESSGGAAVERLEEEKRARAAEFEVEGETRAGDGARSLGGASGAGPLGRGAWRDGGEGEEKPQSALRAYVGSFDPATLQSAVTVRSREGISVVERHTEALFGKPELIAQEGGVAVLKDDTTHVTVTTLRRLILEAAAFGNFLWDVETYVDSQCKITTV